MVSTWALLLGLAERGGGGTTADGGPVLYSVDIEPPPEDALAPLVRAAAAVNVKHVFVRHDSATWTLPRPVDLMFIDTMHVYGHLRRELAQHADRAASH